MGTELAGEKSQEHRGRKAARPRGRGQEPLPCSARPTLPRVERTRVQIPTRSTKQVQEFSLLCVGNIGILRSQAAVRSSEINQDSRGVATRVLSCDHGFLPPVSFRETPNRWLIPSSPASHKADPARRWVIHPDSCLPERELLTAISTNEKLT